MTDKYGQLVERYPDWVSLDKRAGYEGVVVQSDHLVEFATALRDQHHFDFLSSVTGVDYLEKEMMEVVYHAFRSTGGAALVFKVQVPRQEPVVPSLVPIFKGAEFQEREAWDLLGIRFEGHPNLKRILTWEGFAGHPLRKDWQEPYYEQDTKHFDSRWPEGSPVRDEERTSYEKNVQYPDDFDPNTWVPDEHDTIIYEGVKDVIREHHDLDLDTDTITVNLGPQHPSTHGVFRMVVRLEGETVLALKPVMGYLHRNHEKIGERNTYLMNIPFTDRLDYLASMSNNFGYVLAVEKLLGKRYQPPERAQYIRVMMAELTRITSHLFAIGSLLNDMGAYFTPMLYALKERELIIDVFEAVTGSRMMGNYFRFGGVARDLPEGTEKKIHDLAFERLPRQIDELDRYLTRNELVIARAQGIGVLTPEEAIASSVSGPVLRASGVPYDIRRADPYSIYDRFDFDVVVKVHGDVYDRYLVRLEEMRQSVRIVQQVLKQLPEGKTLAGRPSHKHRVPAGEAYGRVEAPKGELGFYIVSDGESNPYRYHVRAPSFVNLTSLEKMCIGNKVADAVVILGSLDIVLGEVDR